jgi:hypothetical protein
MNSSNTDAFMPIQEPRNYDWENRVVLITEDEEINFFYLKTIFK